MVLLTSFHLTVLARLTGMPLPVQSNELMPPANSWLTVTPDFAVRLCGQLSETSVSHPVDWTQQSLAVLVPSLL